MTNDRAVHPVEAKRTIGWSRSVNALLIEIALLSATPLIAQSTVSRLTTR